MIDILLGTNMLHCLRMILLLNATPVNSILFLALIPLSFRENPLLKEGLNDVFIITLGPLYLSTVATAYSMHHILSCHEEAEETVDQTAG